MSSSEKRISFAEISSKNEEMERCVELAKAASATTASVLIQGESGTGKDMLAQAIHAASNRMGMPCIILSCAGVPANLLESELFGHDQGAFQGAERTRRGKFELANGGTLILDEISELPMQAQAKILRALEYGEFEHAGGEETLKADVRIIALTSRDMGALVAEGKFREDLFYRINEISIHVPALRQRREDLRDLINMIVAECNEKFSKRVQGISQIGLDYLMRYDFPGNLRELKSLIKRGVTVAKGDLLWLEDLGMRVEVPAENEAGENPEEMLTLGTVEKRHIQQVLNYTKGNKKKASELLKVSRPTLDRKIKIYDLRMP